MNGLASELDHLPPDALDFLDDIIATIVARAAQRGEIGPHPVPAPVLAAPHVLRRHELAVRHHQPTDEELARIVDNIAIASIQHASRC